MVSISAAKVNLISLTKLELRDFFFSIEEEEYRHEQVFKWIHQKGISDFSLMTNLSKDLRKKLKEHSEIKLPEIVFQEDSIDGTRKWVIKVRGSNLIEMVLIPEGTRKTLCVSSQVGCAVDCSFCATGKQGFSRNLTLDEIIGQLWLAERSFGVPGEPNKKNITNVVMMGMGEPLYNYDNVVKENFNEYLSSIFWFILILSISLLIITLVLGELLLSNNLPDFPYTPFFILISSPGKPIILLM